MTRPAVPSISVEEYRLLHGKANAPVRKPTDGLGMNKLELRYADHLATLQAAGIVAWWRPHPFSIRLSCSRNFYRPDFLVQLTSGEVQIHETKGYMEEDALQKLKEVRGLYPFEVRVFKWKGGAWVERIIE